MSFKLSPVELAGMEIYRLIHEKLDAEADATPWDDPPQHTFDMLFCLKLAEVALDASAKFYHPPS